MARVVTVISGEKIEQGRSFTDEAVCCVEINQGCFLEEDGEDQFEDGTCIDGPDGTLCETCDLSFYQTTNLYVDNTAFQSGIPSKTVLGELMNQFSAP